jgi:hypothetical protein
LNKLSEASKAVLLYAISSRTSNAEEHEAAARRHKAAMEDALARAVEVRSEADALRADLYKLTGAE